MRGKEEKNTRFIDIELKNDINVESDVYMY